MHNMQGGKLELLSLLKFFWFFYNYLYKISSPMSTLSCFMCDCMQEEESVELKRCVGVCLNIPLLTSEVLS